eukprot:11070980-Alexandrium_andersonii.AAC.1
MFEPGAAQLQKRPRSWSPKLPRGALCAVARADSEADDGRGCCGGSEVAPRRFPQGARRGFP